jgi:hypothetical protein
MMTTDDKVGGWVKKGQNHDDVILEWSQMLLAVIKLCLFCLFVCLFIWTPSMKECS